MFNDHEWVIYIVTGILTTLQYAIIPLFFGVLLGFFITCLGLSKQTWLNIIAKTYVSIMRGTPLLLQLSILYLAFPKFTGINITAFYAGIIAFSFNSAAYVSEIIRGGIVSIDKGQFEAARSMSIPTHRIVIDIIMPQAIKNIIPALVNEAINLTKESAIIATIGEADLMRRAQIVAAEKYTYFAPLCVAAVCYYAITLGLSYIGKKIEDYYNAKY